ncbi:MAG TPA: hypothetical protein VEB60_03245, partial [Candidatus Paceibacterota bacterium]|nr:hypothetical protein [Candidatus Paceibacterota bacterium]
DVNKPEPLAGITAKGNPAPLGIKRTYGGDKVLIPVPEDVYNSSGQTVTLVIDGETTTINKLQTIKVSPRDPWWNELDFDFSFAGDLSSALVSRIRTETREKEPEATVEYKIGSFDGSNPWFKGMSDHMHVDEEYWIRVTLPAKMKALEPIIFRHSYYQFDYLQDDCLVEYVTGSGTITPCCFRDGKRNGQPIKISAPCSFNSLFAENLTDHTVTILIHVSPNPDEIRRARNNRRVVALRGFPAFLYKKTPTNVGVFETSIP